MSVRQIKMKLSLNMTNVHGLYLKFPARHGTIIINYYCIVDLCFNMVAIKRKQLGYFGIIILRLCMVD